MRYHFFLLLTAAATASALSDDSFVPILNPDAASATPATTKDYYSAYHPQILGYGPLLLKSKGSPVGTPQTVGVSLQVGEETVPAGTPAVAKQKTTEFRNTPPPLVNVPLRYSSSHKRSDVANTNSVEEDEDLEASEEGGDVAEVDKAVSLDDVFGISTTIAPDKEEAIEKEVKAEEKDGDGEEYEYEGYEDEEDGREGQSSAAENKTSSSSRTPPAATAAAASSTTTTTLKSIEVTPSENAVDVATTTKKSASVTARKFTRLTSTSTKKTTSAKKKSNKARKSSPVTPASPAVANEDADDSISASSTPSISFEVVDLNSGSGSGNRKPKKQSSNSISSATLLNEFKASPSAGDIKSLPPLQSPTYIVSSSTFSPAVTTDNSGGFGVVVDFAGYPSDNPLYFTEEKKKQVEVIPDHLLVLSPAKTADVYQKQWTNSVNRSKKHSVLVQAPPADISQFLVPKQLQQQSTEKSSIDPEDTYSAPQDSSRKSSTSSSVKDVSYGSSSSNSVSYGSSSSKDASYGSSTTSSKDASYGGSSSSSSGSYGGDTKNVPVESLPPAKFDFLNQVLGILSPRGDLHTGVTHILNWLKAGPGYETYTDPFMARVSQVASKVMGGHMGDNVLDAFDFIPLVLLLIASGLILGGLVSSNGNLSINGRREDGNMMEAAMEQLESGILMISALRNEDSCSQRLACRLGDLAKDKFKDKKEMMLGAVNMLVPKRYGNFSRSFEQVVNDEDRSACEKECYRCIKV